MASDLCGPWSVVERLAKALGLERCRAATIRLEAGNLVQITAEQFATVRQVEGMAEVFETTEFVLLERPKPKEGTACPPP